MMTFSKDTLEGFFGTKKPVVFYNWASFIRNYRVSSEKDTQNVLSLFDEKIATLKNTGNASAANDLEEVRRNVFNYMTGSASLRMFVLALLRAVQSAASIADADASIVCEELGQSGDGEIDLCVYGAKRGDGEIALRGSTSGVVHHDTGEYPWLCHQ